MLAKKFRLRKKSAFISTYLNKKVVNNDFFVLYAGKLKQKSDEITKVGFVISKKSVKLASKRNKIKRQMREIYRNFVLNKGEYNINNFVSLIFVAKSRCLKENFCILKNKFLELIQKI